jgi:hypothetical protein
VTATLKTVTWRINRALTAVEINNLLAKLVAAGATAGTLDIAGSNAAPTGQGATDKATLVSRSWTVTSN